jgi:hypothetical protein
MEKRKDNPYYLPPRYQNENKTERFGQSFGRRTGGSLAISNRYSLRIVFLQITAQVAVQAADEPSPVKMQERRHHLTWRA